MTVMEAQIAELQSAGGKEPPNRAARSSAVTEPFAVRLLVVLIGFAFIGLFLVLPLVAVFAMALEKGVAAYLAAITESDALSAIRLTLTVAAIAVPLNLIFGIAAAWAIAKFEFAGKSLLTTLIDLPFSVSPVVSGLIYRAAVWRPWLVRAVAEGATTSTSSSPSPAWCWRPSSSPSPSSPAN